MYETIVEALYGLAKGLMSGVVAFFAVLMLAVVYRYFTNEKFPAFLGIAVGLGFWGYSGGLLDIFNQPSLGGVFQILVVMIFVVWGVNAGDKIASKIPKRKVDLFESIRFGKTHTTVKLPNARLIHDMTGKPKVPDFLKTELSDREFSFPSELTIEEINKRVRRRLITDWEIGDADLELDQEGKVQHLAIAAKEKGLSGTIPDGFFALPIESKIMPSNLGSGDFVKIFFDNGQVIEKIEVKGLDKEQRVITVIADMNLLSKINGSKASLVLALPAKMQIPQLVSVEHRSGIVEAFDNQKIVSYLKKVGVQEDVAVEVASKVQDRISKLDPPVSTRLIKAVIVRQLENDNPEAAEKLKSRRLWRF